MVQKGNHPVDPSTNPNFCLLFQYDINDESQLDFIHLIRIPLNSLVHRVDTVGLAHWHYLTLGALITIISSVLSSAEIFDSEYLDQQSGLGLHMYC